MEVRIFNNADEIAQAAADIFTNLIRAKPACVLGLATGASPVETYRELIKRCKKGVISFKDVKTFNLDEYCDLPRDDENSYYTFMHKNLFDSVDLPAGSSHLLDGNAADPEKEAAGYEKLIELAGGIDIQLLGIGRNGHIGFNEPSDKFTEHTYKVKLTESTIEANKKYFDDGKMPHYALTMGISTIMQAKIVPIATGSEKADAIGAAVLGPVSPSCPASVLHEHKDAVMLVDKAAAAKL